MTKLQPRPPPPIALPPHVVIYPTQPTSLYFDLQSMHVAQLSLNFSPAPFASPIYFSLKKKKESRSISYACV